jgi:hypothetical protein
MVNPLPENPGEMRETQPRDDAPRIEPSIVEVFVVAPEIARPLHIRSPRLAHSEQASAFVKQIIAE